MIAAGLVVVIVFLPLVAVNSVTIPFVYRGKWAAFMGLAYVQLSLLSAHFLIHVAPDKFWLRYPTRQRWAAVGGLLLGPLLLSYVLILLFPLVGNSFADEEIDRKFTYVSTEPYARTSRGLVQLRLIDDRSGEHSVVFKKERAERLALKCGDTLTTKGRDSLLGYVIDSEVKTAGTSKLCSQG